MTQTRKKSVIEILVNQAIGYVFSFLSALIIFPILGIESSIGDNLILTLYFTVMSLIRSYVVRRYFNKK